MQDRDQSIHDEVQQIMNNHKGNLVLVRNDNKELPYLIMNRVTHFYLVIETDDLYNALLTELQKAGVEIFEDFKQLQDAHPRKSETPLFWPKDKPWPPT